MHMDLSKLDRLIANAPDGVDEVTNILAYRILGLVQASFGVSPAPPGGPPGVDTGALRASMHVTKQGWAHRVVADGVDYGFSLEFGIERRGVWPFMNPVFEQVKPEVGRIIEEAIRRWL